jgi:hypothetical protein
MMVGAGVACLGPILLRASGTHGGDRPFLTSVGAVGVIL